MMKRIGLLVLIFISFAGYAQKRTKVSSVTKPPKINWKQQNKNHECVSTNFYSVKQRATMYPFSKAAKIVLVSYEDRESVEYHLDTIILNDGTISVFHPPLNVIDYTSPDRIHPKKEEGESPLETSPFWEEKELTKAGIDSLSFLLYNVKFRGKIFIMEQVKCFQPRNGILFYDKENRLLESMAICFECSRTTFSWNEAKVDWCDDKYMLLASFFKKRGMKFGLKR